MLEKVPGDRNQYIVKLNCLGGEVHSLPHRTAVRRGDTQVWKTSTQLKFLTSTIQITPCKLIHVVLTSFLVRVLIHRITFETTPKAYVVFLVPKQRTPKNKEKL